MQEARDCAESATELIRDAIEIETARAEWSGPRFDNRFGLCSGNASYGSVRIDKLDAEKLAQKMIEIIEDRDDFGALPVQATGSTGQDWFAEHE